MNSIKRLTILIDMDDVLENLVECWVAALNRKHVTTVKPEDITNWLIGEFFPSLTKEELFAPLNDPAFWGNLSPMPFAQDVICRLIDDGHLVRVVTSSYYNTVPPKMTWLFKHYPYLCWKDVIIAHDKKLINGDVLIDDGVHNLENAKYKKLLFDQPHNRSYNAEENGMIRVHDWNEIYRAICEIAGGEE